MILRGIMRYYGIARVTVSMGGVVLWVASGDAG